MASNQKESRLTKIAREHSALELEYLSKKSVSWLREKVRKIKDPSQLANAINREGNRQVYTSGAKLGNVYFYKYDPKYAKVLKYYDVFPLVIILDKYADGFLGLNLHYLPPLARATFLEALLPYTKFDNDNNPQKIRITYNILQKTKSLKFFQPCLKRYLYSHMKSNFLKIEPSEFETSIFLPVEQFRKARKDKVQRDSINQISQGK